MNSELSYEFRMKKAFTLIETIVVIGILGLILPALFAIIFVILQQQSKIYRLSEVKRQGDHVLNVMGNVIRNYAVQIYSDQTLTSGNEKCATAGPPYSSSSSFYFKDKSTNGNWLRFYVSGNRIASESAVIPVAESPVYLTTSAINISNFSLTCNRSSLYSYPIISVGFKATYNSSSSRPEDSASLDYQTNIKLRPHSL